jgi:hypothetical protein
MLLILQLLPLAAATTAPAADTVAYRYWYDKYASL